MKKINTFLFLISLLTLALYSQNTQAQTDKYLPFAQVMPEPVGGLQAIYSKITYPEMARKAGVEGKVYVLVYVNQNGGVDNVKVIKGIGAGCDQAAIRGVEKTKFTAGKNDGKPVNVKLSLAIVFKLSA